MDEIFSSKPRDATGVPRDTKVFRKTERKTGVGKTETSKPSETKGHDGPESPLRESLNQGHKSGIDEEIDDDEIVEVPTTLARGKGLCQG